MLNILSLISLPFDVYLSEFKVFISLTGHNYSTEMMIHFLIYYWIKSEAVIDFLIKVLTIC